MNDGTVIGLSISLVFLIAFSAFFSATETAFSSLSKARLKSIAQHNKKAQTALDLSENFDRLLSTILIGNNIVNILAASLGTLLFVNFLGDIGATVSTAVLTILVLTFGEITPKSLAKEKPESFAIMVAPIIKFFNIIFFPIAYFYELWKKLLIKIFKLKKQPTITEEEFEIIVGDIKDEGILNEVEHDLIINSLKYDDTLIKTVYTQLDRVDMVSKIESFENIKRMFIETNYSRLPVYTETRANIIGVVYRADFYELLLDGITNIDNIIKPVTCINEDMKISSALKFLQKKKIHLACVYASIAIPTTDGEDDSDTVSENEAEQISDSLAVSEKEEEQISDSLAVSEKEEEQISDSLAVSEIEEEPSNCDVVGIVTIDDIVEEIFGSMVDKYDL